MKSRLLGFGAAFLLQGAPPVWTQTGLARLDSLAPAERVTRLADTYVREYKAAYPELALLSGFTLARHDGLSDNSLAALAAWWRSEDQWWKEVSAVDPASLWGRPEWITYGFLHEALRSARETRVCRSELWPVSQLSGWQALFTLLADIQPVGSEEHRSQALARWGRLPRYLERETANLRTGVKLGYTTPRHNVELAVAQLERILALPLEGISVLCPGETGLYPGVPIVVEGAAHRRNQPGRPEVRRLPAVRVPRPGKTRYRYLGPSPRKGLLPGLLSRDHQPQPLAQGDLLPGPGAGGEEREGDEGAGSKRAGYRGCRDASEASGHRHGEPVPLP